MTTSDPGQLREKESSSGWEAEQGKLDHSKNSKVFVDARKSLAALHDKIRSSQPERTLDQPRASRAVSVWSRTPRQTGNVAPVKGLDRVFGNLFDFFEKRVRSMERSSVLSRADFEKRCADLKASLTMLQESSIEYVVRMRQREIQRTIFNSWKYYKDSYGFIQRSRSIRHMKKRLDKEVHTKTLCLAFRSWKGTWQISRTRLQFVDKLAAAHDSSFLALFYYAWKERAACSSACRQYVYQAIKSTCADGESAESQTAMTPELVSLMTTDSTDDDGSPSCAKERTRGYGDSSTYHTPGSQPRSRPRRKRISEELVQSLSTFSGTSVQATVRLAMQEQKKRLKHLAMLMFKRAGAYEDIACMRKAFQGWITLRHKVQLKRHRERQSDTMEVLAKYKAENQKLKEQVEQLTSEADRLRTFQTPTNVGTEPRFDEPRVTPPGSLRVATSKAEIMNKATPASNSTGTDGTYRPRPRPVRKKNSLTTPTKLFCREVVLEQRKLVIDRRHRNIAVDLAEEVNFHFRRAFSMLDEHDKSEKSIDIARRELLAAQSALKKLSSPDLGGAIPLNNSLDKLRDGRIFSTSLEEPPH